ncbi:MAG: hypothetical protein Q9162_005457 [Coniocarpon cinnabarinum]
MDTTTPQQEEAAYYASVIGGHGPLMITVIMCEFLLATAVISARNVLYVCRGTIGGKGSLIAADVAWGIGTISNFLLFASFMNGGGNRDVYIQVHGTTAKAAMFQYTSIMVSGFSIGVGKLAAALFLAYLIDPCRKYTRFSLYALGTIVVNLSAK